MRVLHTMGRMAGNGTERQLAGMLLAAKSAGLWEPVLCVMRSGSEQSSELRAQGIDVIELGATPRRPDTLYRRLRHQLRDDVDLVHSSLWGANAVTRAAVLGKGRPAVVVSERRVEQFRPRPMRAVDRVLCSVTDHFIGNSIDVGRFIEDAHGVPPSRVSVIPNGIDDSVFHPGPERARNGPLKVRAVGRLVEQKGFDILIDAVRELAEDTPVELEIGGTGPLAGELSKRASGLPVTFAGYMSDPSAVAEHLRAGDVFVMPSRYEGLPNAVLEALACGLPVVATDVPGMREAVAGTGATIVPPDDASAIAGALRRLAANPVPVARPSISSFLDVANGHAEVFDAAVSRRRSVRSRSSA